MAKRTRPEPVGNMEQMFTTAPLGSLREDPENARRHPEKNMEAIKKSLVEFGQVEPLVVQASTGKVIGGNGRLRAMRELGWASAKIAVVDIDDMRARALGIALNRTAELAEWDAAALGQALHSLEGAGDTFAGLYGFDETELTRYLDAGLPAAEDVPELPDAPAVDVPRRAECGDVWTLGRHEVRCCDWREALPLYRGRGSLLLTDPPYNVAEQVAAGGLPSLRPKSYGKLAAAAWDRGFEPSPDIFELVGADAVALVFTSHDLFGRWCGLAGEAFWSVFFGVWSKTNPMPAISRRHWTSSAELAIYATRGKHVFNFPADGHALSVWEFPVDSRAPRHPTAKPVALMRHLIQTCSDARAVVVDPFLGGGSTLLAAEETGRTCLACEMAPEWVDLTIYRFEKATGLTATKQHPSTTQPGRVK